MNSDNEIKQENHELKEEKVESIETLQEQTRVSVLDTFYRDEWMFSKVFSIITWKKINPSDLVDNLWSVRWEFKKLDASNDDEFEQAA